MGGSQGGELWGGLLRDCLPPEEQDVKVVVDAPEAQVTF